MSILVDSSVLAAGTAQHHPAFGECRQWLRSTGARTELAFTTHAVAELYSTFTHPRGMFRMTPREATLIIIRLRNRLRIVPLSGADYYKVLATAVGKHVLNGNVYDVLHAQAALLRQRPVVARDRVLAEAGATGDLEPALEPAGATVEVQP